MRDLAEDEPRDYHENDEQTLKKGVLHGAQNTLALKKRATMTTEMIGRRPRAS